MALPPPSEKDAVYDFMRKDLALYGVVTAKAVVELGLVFADAVRSGDSWTDVLFKLGLVSAASAVPLSSQRLVTPAVTGTFSTIKVSATPSRLWYGYRERDR